MEEIEEINSTNDVYLHDSIHSLFGVYSTATDNNIKKAAKKRYNELVAEEHKRLGRDIFKPL